MLESKTKVMHMKDRQCYNFIEFVEKEVSGRTYVDKILDHTTHAKVEINGKIKYIPINEIEFIE